MPIVGPEVVTECASMGAAWVAVAAAVAGLAVGLVAGAWYDSRVESLPPHGRIQMKMVDIRQRQRLQQYMKRNATPLAGLRQRGEPDGEDVAS